MLVSIEPLLSSPNTSHLHVIDHTDSSILLWPNMLWCSTFATLDFKSLISFAELMREVIRKINLSYRHTALLIAFLVGCSATLPITAQAQGNIGTAPYAIFHAQWPCEAQWEADKKVPELRLAVLWNTFGKSTACLQRYLNDSRLKTLEIHLINEVCQRHNRCGPYEFAHGLSIKQYETLLRKRDPQLLEKLRMYLQEPAAFLARYLGTHTECYVSIGLESNISRRAALVIKKELRAAFPTCKVVWNPNGINPSARPIKDTTFELHHSSSELPSPCIANLDGKDVNFPSRPARLSPSIGHTELSPTATRFSNCIANFLWIAEYNGLKSGAFVDPRMRTKTSFPSASTFELMTQTQVNLMRSSVVPDAVVEPSGHTAHSQSASDIPSIVKPHSTQ